MSTRWTALSAHPWKHENTSSLGQKLPDSAGQTKQIPLTPAFADGDFPETSVTPATPTAARKSSKPRKVFQHTDRMRQGSPISGVSPSSVLVPSSDALCS